MDASEFLKSDWKPENALWFHEKDNFKGVVTRIFDEYKYEVRTSSGRPLTVGYVSSYQQAKRKVFKILLFYANR